MPGHYLKMAIIALHLSLLLVITGCPNKSARFKVRAIVVLLGWRH